MISIPQLLSRLVIGYIFATSGWGKFQDLPRIVEFFNSLGIPAAHLQAPFVAGVELICGVLILIGLFTRLATLPLIATMTVAIATAKLSDITDLSAFFDLSEFLYIVILIWLFVCGAGIFSIDYFLKKSGALDKLSKCL